jgi:hypothetical protein
MSTARKSEPFVRSLSIIVLCLVVRVSTAAPVTLLRTPDGGIQPQVAVDAQGDVHLIYFKGKPMGGDIFYVCKPAGQSVFSRPIKVNSQPGSAIATGTIRGAHIAVGRNSSVHVAWMGGEGAKRAKVDGKEVTPMLYTRWDDAKAAFEPERNLITWAAGLDGGGSIAADMRGNVYVAWHASPPGNERGEAGRAVFVTRSNDDGKTFQRETKANPKPTGACGCCGMRAFTDAKEGLYLLYRAANEISRDMTLLVSRDQGATFETATVNKWMIKGCPMSSASLAEGSVGVIAATELNGQIYFNTIESPDLKVSAPVSAPGEQKRKHPALATNKNGETLLAWTEGTGWEKGGTLGWQVFEADGKPSAHKGRADGVPVWSLATAFANSDGSFVIVY